MIRRITGYLWRIWERFSILGQLDAEIAAANREIVRCQYTLRELEPALQVAEARAEVLGRIADMSKPDNVRDPVEQLRRIYVLVHSVRES